MSWGARRHRHRATASARTAAAVLRRAGWRATVQTTALIALLLVVVAVLVFALDGRAQRRVTDQFLTQVVARADDAGDPPPGVALALRGRSGAVTTSPAAPQALRAFLDGPVGYADVRLDGADYRVLVKERSGKRVAALIDLRPREAAERRLLASVLLASLTALAGAGVVVALLSRRAMRPLARALSLQRRFVADASHELRAPLTVLHTRAQMLANRADRAGLDEGWRRQLGGLVTDTRALGEVVEDLLLTAELEAHAETHRLVDLEAVAEQVRDAFAAHAQAAGVDLRVQAGSAAVVVLGSELALRRAVSALVDNALGHERPGGSVLIQLDRDPDVVRLTVADTGVGLDPAAAERLFARSAHGAQQPRGGRRYGIGLALVQEVVTEHGGRVLVAGAPGKGAAFTLVLPAQTANVEAEPRNRTAPGT